MARPIDAVLDLVADERNEPTYDPDLLRSPSRSDETRSICGGVR
jgi:hypothetical protein